MTKDLDKQKSNALITTFGNDIYIIRGKTPDEVQDLIDAGGDMVRMPNGARVNKKSIATIQSYEDYTFQVDQKVRHKKGQYLKSGEWCDNHGEIGVSAHLERITGELKVKALASGSAKEIKSLEGKK